jgi:hypothetical protein
VGRLAARCAQSRPSLGVTAWRLTSKAHARWRRRVVAGSFWARTGSVHAIRTLVSVLPFALGLAAQQAHTITDQRGKMFAFTELA